MVLMGIKNKGCSCDVSRMSQNYWKKLKILYGFCEKHWIFLRIWETLLPCSDL